MSEPAANIFRCYLFDGGSQGITKFSLRAGLELTQNCFDFGNALFNRIKVWRVGWQILHPRTRSFDQAHGTFTVMKLHVIKKHHVTRAQFRHEKMLDVKVKDLAVDRSFNSHRRQDATQRERADNRHVGPVIEWLNHFRSCPARRSRVSPGHDNIDRKFINKDQARRGQPSLFLDKLGAFYRIGFTRPLRLFFLVNASSSSQRQTVLSTDADTLSAADQLAEFIKCRIRVLGD